MVFMILNAYFINIDLSPFLKENSELQIKEQKSC